MRACSSRLPCEQAPDETTKKQINDSFSHRLQVLIRNLRARLLALNVSNEIFIRKSAFRFLSE